MVFDESANVSRICQRIAIKKGIALELYVNRRIFPGWVNNGIFHGVSKRILYTSENCGEISFYQILN